MSFTGGSCDNSYDVVASKDENTPLAYILHRSDVSANDMSTFWQKFQNEVGEELKVSGLRLVDVKVD